MAKFTTIWGDMEVGSITPAPQKANAEQRSDPEETKLPDKEEESEETTTVPIPTADSKTEDAEEPEEGKDKEKAEEEDKYVFTEEDVNKAFTILEDEGVLELDDEFDAEATPAGLADAVAYTVRKKLENEIAQIPPVVQDFYRHVMEGKEAQEFVPAVETDWSEMIQTEEANQKVAYFKYLKDQALSDAEAQEEVNDAIERGILDKKAKIAFSSLIGKQEKLKTTKAEAQAKAEKMAEEKRKGEIDEINKIIDSWDEYAGFKLDDKKKQSFKDYLYKPNPRTGKTQVQENMSNEERRLRVAFLDFVDYNKKDLEKEITSNVTNERKKKLSRYSDKSPASSNSSRSVSQTGNKNQGRGSIKFPTIFGGHEIEVED